MSKVAIILAGALAVSPAAFASELPPDQTAAFQQAYGASFYTFDACGDGVAGRIYRRALMARFTQCPFSEAARTRFQQWTALQRERSSRMIAKLIEEHDGVPLRLEGMPMTCREQRADPDYVAVRGRLSHYEVGIAGSDAVIPEGCTASSLSPYVGAQ